MRATHRGGNRRLDDPHDFVRLEIETALSLGLTIIPLPVDSATMPASVDLPESLRSLTILNALQVRNDPDFARDMERVMAGVERGFASRPGGLFGRRGTSTPRNQPTPTKSQEPAENKPATPVSSSPQQAAVKPVKPPVVKNSPTGAEKPTLPSGVARIRRPLIAGLAAIVVVASFAILFANDVFGALRPQGSSPNISATQTSAAEFRFATNLAISNHATATAFVIKAPYSATGPGCDSKEFNLVP